MKLTRIRADHIHGEWCHKECRRTLMNENRLIPSRILSLTDPWMRVDASELQPITEATYKEIATLIDGNFLNQTVRANELKGIKLAGFDNDTMVFEVNRSEFDQNGIRYRCLVKFNDWDEFGRDQDLDFNEKSRMLLWIGNIQLHCTDPRFLYWGYQYILSVLDSAIYPEERKAVERNPGDRGVVCKHLNRVLRVLPFYSGDIAKELKRQFGS